MAPTLHTFGSEAVELLSLSFPEVSVGPYSALCSQIIKMGPSSVV